jgi:hypothetical protein
MQGRVPLVVALSIVFFDSYGRLYPLVPQNATTRASGGREGEGMYKIGRGCASRSLTCATSAAVDAMRLTASPWDGASPLMRMRKQGAKSERPSAALSRLGRLRHQQCHTAHGQPSYDFVTVL